VADVAADLNSEVTADGARSRVSGVGSTEHDTAGLDDVKTLPAHSNNGTGGHVLAETLEEGLGGEVLVVLSSELLGGSEELHAAELEALVLKALDDLTNKTALNTIGLDSNESTLSLSTSNTSNGHFYSVKESRNKKV